MKKMRKINVFRKKIGKIFGGMKKKLYLCTRNSEITLMSDHEHP